MPTEAELATNLLELTELMRRIYHPVVLEAHPRWQSPFNKLITLSRRKFQGSELIVQVEDRNAYPARMSKNVHQAYPDPQRGSGKNYTVRIANEQANNDMGRLHTSCEVTTLDRKRDNGMEVSAIDDFVEKKFNECVKDVAESRAIHQHIPTTALLGLVNGTPVKNDADLVSEGSAIASTGGARFNVDNGSLVFFGPGRKIDVYNGSGSGAVKRFSAMVMDNNPRDMSVGIQRLDSDGNPSSSEDCSAMADNDGLYIQDEKDQNPVGVGSWMTRVAGTASDTLFQRDRNTSDYRFMKPYFSGPSTARAFALDDWDSFTIEMNYRTEQDMKMLCSARPELIKTAQNLIGKDAIINYPLGDKPGRPQYGWDSLTQLRDVNLGVVLMNPNVMMPENQFWFNKEGSWEEVHFYEEKFLWQKGLIGYWYRTVSSSNNGSLTDNWRADGHQLSVVICTDPGANGAILNVLPTAKASLVA